MDQLSTFCPCLKKREIRRKEWGHGEGESEGEREKERRKGERREGKKSSLRVHLKSKTVLRHIV